MYLKYLKYSTKRNKEKKQTIKICASFYFCWTQIRWWTAFKWNSPSHFWLCGNFKRDCIHRSITKHPHTHSMQITNENLADRFDFKVSFEKFDDFCHNSPFALIHLKCNCNSFALYSFYWTSIVFNTTWETIIKYWKD